jgi:hypothetical protein
MKGVPIRPEDVTLPPGYPNPNLWPEQGVGGLCPTCRGKKMLIPMGYQGEPTNCPTCTRMTIEQAVTEICELYGCAPRGGTPELFGVLTQLRESIIGQRTAEIPPEMQGTPTSALRLISMSQDSDFADGGAWAKWCRAVACAGLMKDGDKLERLERRVDGILHNAEGQRV